MRTRTTARLVLSVALSSGIAAQGCTVQDVTGIEPRTDASDEQASQGGSSGSAGAGGTSGVGGASGEGGQDGGAGKGGQAGDADGGGGNAGAADAGPDQSADAQEASADVGAEDAVVLDTGAEADAAVELCGNGKLDPGEDCDGPGTDPCTTSCNSTGTRQCVQCKWSATCTPPTEVCQNSQDDDCDGQIDEIDPGQCSPGMTVSCTTTCGSTGSGVCTTGCVPPTGAACLVPAEACNSVDDNCDGQINEGVGCIPGEALSCTTSCGSQGNGWCNASCEIPTGTACVVPTEVCNGADDDCDGSCDEGFGCCANGVTPCTTSCGSTGTVSCSSTCAPGLCVPPAEVCNGIDDDCDGTADNGFGCSAGQVEDCTSSCSTLGKRTCQSSCNWGACVPPTEVCNGLDDDCDGVKDQGFACIKGAIVGCKTTCNSNGTGACTNQCTVPAAGACTPPVEVCNGYDDDCDGTCDEGYACCANQTSPCTTSCGSTGSSSCSSGCLAGACVPPQETCNGLDDDCSGKADDKIWCPVTNPTAAGFVALWGLSSTSIWAVGSGGTILYWNGASWTQQASGTTRNLNGVWASSQNNVWAVGNYCTVLRNTGSGWAEVSHPACSPTNADLRGVWGASASDFWVVGSYNPWHWTGSALNSVTISGGAGAYHGVVWGTAANDVWFGATTITSRWNGSAWSNSGLATGGAAVAGIWGANASDVWVAGGRLDHWNGSVWTYSAAVSGATDAWGFSSANVWMSMPGQLAHWNGAVWAFEPVPTGTVRSVWGAVPNDIWAVTDDGGIYRRIE